MSEARIGRIVAAALHQAVVDVLPLRLEFYESYLEPRRLRTGTVGVASFWAALSFLRRDGDAYPLVMSEAGRRAADWMWETVPGYQAASWRRLPSAWRARVVLRLARRLVSDTLTTSRATSRVRRGTGRLVIEGSGFCDPRAAASAPLCGFYVAAVERLCQHLAVAGRVGAEACRGMSGEACVVVLRLGAGDETRESDPQSAEAAP